MPIGEQLFLQVALADHHMAWELLRSELRRKPSTTRGCSETIHRIGFALAEQIERTEWHSRINGGYLRVSHETYYRPDGFVIPADRVGYGLDRYELEHYSIPMPLVVEVWPRYRQEYVYEHHGEPMERIRCYKRRGDQEIWLVHSYTHRLTAWRRRSENSYSKLVMNGGMIQPAFLPGVSIDLDSLFR